MKKASSDSEDVVLHTFDINDMQVGIKSLWSSDEDKYTNKEEIKCKIMG